MKRRGPQSRWQNRKLHQQHAQVVRTLHTPRGSVVLVAVRQPDRGETPLSDDEIWHGIRAGLLAPVPLRTFRTAEKGGRT